MIPGPTASTARESFALGCADKVAGRKARRLEDPYLGGYAFAGDKTEDRVRDVIRARAKGAGFDADAILADAKAGAR